jgi:hypothetical protein
MSERARGEGSVGREAEGREGVEGGREVWGGRDGRKEEEEGRVNVKLSIA